MNQPKWRSTALALATAVLLGAWASDAAALALGRVTVQSALGEPLRADIEIVEINAEEAATLRATVASPEAFRAAGLDYSPALANVEITLQRRPDGRHFLQLSSQRPVNDPFIDLILETRWASGRIVRDYTMLFDPANLRQSAPPAAAQIAPVAPPEPRPEAAPQAPAPAAAPVARETPQAPGKAGGLVGPDAVTSSGKADAKQVKVQSGDTLGKIAAANKPVNISLDQMLVALLHANPDAFINGNVNRLKAGTVLEIPSAEQAAQESAGEARQAVIAQSRDFNEYRRRLAEGVATTRVAPAERQATGKVEAKVQEKKPAPPSPDKLTLSKGAVQGKAVEDKIAREREAKDAATRLAELNKNISDLNRLGTTTAAPAATTAASAPKTAPAAVAPAPSASAARATAPVAVPAIPVPAALPAPPPAPAAAAVSVAKPASDPAAPAPAASVPAASVALAPAAAPASAPTPAALGPAPAASTPVAAAMPASSPAVAAKPAPVAKPAPPPPAESSLVEDLVENPFVIGGLGLVLAGLLGFGFYKVRERKKATQVDSSFLESRLQPDSFFGASGGQRIDTNEGGATGSSMVYSPSQLDAAGDVDPVAEADVYLAYGRDLQAEEILKEAMRTTPQRVAIHSKLLEIYSKRRDTKAFEMVATEAYNLSHGEGPEWEHICELGQELDPGNTLYRPGGQPTGGAAVASAAAPRDFGATVATQVEPQEESTGPVDLDLDLDFSLGDDSPPPAAAAPTAPVKVKQSEPTQSLNMDFGATAVVPAPTAAKPLSELAETTGKIEPIPVADLPDLELPDSGLTFTTEPVAAREVPAAAPAPAASADAGMIEFDLGALSLDLPNAAAPAPQAEVASVPAAAEAAPMKMAEAGSTGGYDDSGSSGDPLATKFALAQEFNAIGDPDGARSLAEEVLAEASGDLKHRAQRFLAEIG